MQRRCQSCSAEVSENAKFCRSCGGKIEVLVTESQNNVCPDCGKDMPLGAKFCRHCGSKLKHSAEKISSENEKPLTSVKPKQLVCSTCGGELNKSSKFCRTCGAVVSAAVQEVTEQPKVDKLALDSLITLKGIACAAPEVAGEFVFPGTGVISDVSRMAVNPSVKAAAVYTGPIKVLFSGGWHLFTVFFGALRSPGRLLPGLLLGFVWVVLSTLPALGITLPGHEIASWLTFAQGGLQGGTQGALGGILGKGVFAGTLIGIFKRNPRKPRVSSIRNGEPNKRGSIGLLLIGVGLALIFYNFFTWDNSLQNSMIGLIAAVGTLRAMGRENSFISRLLTALTQRLSPKRLVRHKDVKLLGGGLTTGFALAVPMSFIAGPVTGYALGLLFLVPGLVFSILKKSGEAVKGA